MHQRLPVGLVVNVRLHPDEGGPLVLEGKVIYRKDVFGEEMTIDPGVGIAFTSSSPAEAVRLGTMVRQLLAGGLFQDPDALIVDPESTDS
jgi:hypothetical protein